MITSEIEYQAVLDRINEHTERLNMLAKNEEQNDLDIINAHKRLTLLHDDAFRYQSEKLFGVKKRDENRPQSASADKV